MQFVMLPEQVWQEELQGVHVEFIGINVPLQEFTQLPFYSNCVELAQEVQ